MNEQSQIMILISVVIVPLLALPAGYLLWLWVMNRPPSGKGRAIVPEYGPPADIGPAEAGVLLEQALHPRAFAAMLLDLSLRGAVEITEAGGRIESLRLVSGPGAAKVAPYERYLLDRLFEKNYSTDAKTAAAALAKCRQDLHQIIRRTLKEKGVLTDHPFLAVIVLAASVIAAVILAVGIMYALGVVVAAVIGLVAVFLGQLAYFALNRPALSARGRQVLRDLYGFRMYLGAAEGDRIKWEEQEERKVHRFTPYAIVFDISVTWSNKLQHLSKALLENIL